MMNGRRALGFERCILVIATSEIVDLFYLYKSAWKKTVKFTWHSSVPSPSEEEDTIHSGELNGTNEGNIIKAFESRRPISDH